MTDINIPPETLAAFDGNEQRAKVFLDRYSQKDENGNPIETMPAEMWDRVAYAIGDTDDERDLFYDLLKDFKFVPGGRILAGAGTDTEVTFANCYVIPVETKARREYRSGSDMFGADKGSDSREAIIDTIGVMVDIMSRGGGVGINWSVLRPSGAHLKRINATSSGPIDWMHFASTAVGTVEQGGSRRGAAMFMLDDWHPDIYDFIDAKRDLTRITNANVSVCISDAFMEAVANDEDWQSVFPDTAHHAYDSEWDGDLAGWKAKGYPVISYGWAPARHLWRKLAEAAWDNGEPGVFFIDRANEERTGDDRLIATNPCGEMPLSAYDVCNLGAMNLAAYILDEAGYSPSGKSFDWLSFGEDVKIAIRFLDRVVDKTHYFLPENKLVQKANRRTGLSVMGLADALVMLGVRYGTPDAVTFTENVFQAMKDSAIESSVRLGAELGPAPAWRTSMWERPYLSEFYNRSLVYESYEELALRNIYLLTQAPTGTTSILAGVNSGIEPFFATSYTRTDRTGTHRVVPSAIAAHEAIDGEPCDGSCGFVVTANEVTVEEHIAMQAAAQKYVDNSISKTINAPNSHTVEDVERAFTLAYESGLKGLAYFRDGCGRAQVLSTEKPVEDKDGFHHIDWCDSTGAYGALDCSCPETDREIRLMKQVDLQRSEFARPDVLTGRTHKVRAGQQNVYVTVNREVAIPDDRPVEVFVNAGKAGTDLMAMGEAVGRLASLSLQLGASLDELIEQLDGVGNNGLLNRSLPSAIAAALRNDVVAALNDAQKIDDFMTHLQPMVSTAETEPFNEAWFSDEPWLRGDLEKCPDCGAESVVREEGCRKCHACGWSAC